MDASYFFSYIDKCKENIIYTLKNQNIKTTSIVVLALGVLGIGCAVALWGKRIAKKVADREAQIRGEISSCLKSGFPLNEKFIKNHFEFLENHQQIETCKQLEIEINQLIFQKELQTLLKSYGKGETRLLKFLGYDVTDESPYYDQQQVLNHLLSRIMNGNSGAQEENSVDQLLPLLIKNGNFNKGFFSGSAVHFRENLEKEVLYARLNALGIHSASTIDKFERGLRVMELAYDHIQSIQKNVELIFPKEFPAKAVLAKTMIEECFNHGKFKSAMKFIKRIVKDAAVKTHFLSTTMTPLEFEAYLKEKINQFTEEEIIKECQESSLYKKAHRNLSFYCKWGEYIQTEILQGFENEQEVLIDGVCLAMSSRLQILGQTQPTLSAEQFANHVKIMPIDRFRQAGFNVSVYSHSSFGFNFLKERGFDPNPQVHRCDKYSFEDFFQDPRFPAKICHGWLNVGFLGDEHAVVLCLDRTKNRLWFIDTNMGFLCFEKSGQSFETSKKIFFTFFQELLEMNYPLSEHLTIRRFLPT